MKEQKPQKQEPETVKCEIPSPYLEGAKPDEDGVVRMPENGKYQ